MRRSDVLRSLISESGLSLKAFAEKIDMPYTTLYTMLDKGVGKAYIDNVIKVCRALGITVEKLEDLANGKPQQQEEETAIETLAAHFDGDQMTEEEMSEIMEFVKYIKSKRK